MRLANRTADFTSYTQSQIQAMAWLKEAGFSYIDYSFGVDYTRKNGIYGEKYLSYMQDVKKAMVELDVQLVQAHSPMGKPLPDESGEFTADTIRCIEACGEWGIPNLVVHSGYMPGISREECLARNKEFFLKLLTHAEKYGVNILVENFNKMYKEDVYWIDNATDLLALIELVDHPLFHAVWDAGHANLQEIPQDEELRKLGSHVKALHIQDNMGIKDSHLTPFLGTMNLDSLMTGLLDIGYDGYFTFEVGGVFTPASKRREFSRDTRLATPPFQLRMAFERFLYTLGKTILESYNCFEP